MPVPSKEYHNARGVTSTLKNDHHFNLMDILPKPTLRC